MQSDVNGKGFARRVTTSNFEDFAPLLRDRTRLTASGEVEDNGSDAISDVVDNVQLQITRDLFAGRKVAVRLPFRFPSRTSRPTPKTTSSDVDGPATSVATSMNLVTLVAELPGPGRWSQGSFNYEVFSTFFGGKRIELIHVNSDGTTTLESDVRPIVKKSSNYCYELGAAAGLEYPFPNRPIVVFVRIGEQQFLYRLVMPSVPDYAVLDAFLTTHCEGIPRRIRRVITDLTTLTDFWPAAPFTPHSIASNIS